MKRRKLVRRKDGINAVSSILGRDVLDDEQMELDLFRAMLRSWPGARLP